MEEATMEDVIKLIDNHQPIPYSCRQLFQMLENTPIDAYLPHYVIIINRLTGKFDDTVHTKRFFESDLPWSVFNSYELPEYWKEIPDKYLTMSKVDGVDLNTYSTILLSVIHMFTINHSIKDTLFLDEFIDYFKTFNQTNLPFVRTMIIRSFNNNFNKNIYKVIFRYFDKYQFDINFDDIDLYISYGRQYISYTNLGDLNEFAQNFFDKTMTDGYVVSSYYTNCQVLMIHFDELSMTNRLKLINQLKDYSEYELIHDLVTTENSDLIIYCFEQFNLIDYFRNRKELSLSEISELFGKLILQYVPSLKSKIILSLSGGNFSLMKKIIPEITTLDVINVLKDYASTSDPVIVRRRRIVTDPFD